MTITVDDDVTLIDALVTHRNNCIYASIERDKGAVCAFRTLWQRRSPPRAITDPEKWSLELIAPHRPDAFSFVRPMNSDDPCPPDKSSRLSVEGSSRSTPSVPHSR